jgi:16S rRNA (guanine527-N7)-methyltransferase
MNSLQSALSEYEIELPPEQTQQLQRFCRLLWEWNEKLNLTRHTTFELFVTRDLVDAQQLALLLDSGERVLDLGSGGGVPGLVVAILRPDVRVELCECIGKKARVLEDLVQKLTLNVPVHAKRVEDALSQRGVHYDAIMARAVGPLTKMLRMLKPHWQSIDRMFVVKGPKWVEERGEARHLGLLKDIDLRKVVTYEPPGAKWQSVILKLSRPRAGPS